MFTKDPEIHVGPCLLHVTRHFSSCCRLILQPKDWEIGLRLNITGILLKKKKAQSECE